MSPDACDAPEQRSESMQALFKTTYGRPHYVQHIFLDVLLDVRLIH